MSKQIKHGLGVAEIIGDKRARILELAQQHGASNVQVFGSVARGEARPDSDLDLPVSFADNRSIFDLTELWQDVSELMGREVDLLAHNYDEIILTNIWLAVEDLPNLRNSVEALLRQLEQEAESANADSASDE